MRVRPESDTHLVVKLFNVNSKFDYIDKNFKLLRIRPDVRNNFSVTWDRQNAWKMTGIITNFRFSNLSLFAISDFF
jgi:hypothetical protein